MRNKNNYSENWNDVIRPDILKRDAYKCTKCGITHRAYVLKASKGIYIEITQFQMVQFREQGKTAFRIFLQVAHLDNNPSNNDYSNLAAVCPPCHLSLDAVWRNLKRLSNKAAKIISLGAVPTHPKPPQK